LCSAPTGIGRRSTREPSIASTRVEVSYESRRADRLKLIDEAFVVIERRSTGRAVRRGCD
jgi:hypothetical protein